MYRQGYNCLECDEQLVPGQYHLDHVVSLFDGGRDTLDNLQALCLNCHASKTMAEELRRLHNHQSASIDSLRVEGNRLQFQASGKWQNAQREMSRRMYRFLLEYHK